VSKTVGEVAIDVTADIGPLVKSMGRGKHAVGQFGNKVSGMDRRLAASRKGLLAVGKAVGMVSAAMTAAVGALVAFGQRQAGVIDENAKMARSLGLTHDQFKAMAFVAEEAGVSTENLSTSLGMMQRNMVEAAQGTQAQVDAFNTLGIAISDLEGLSPDEQFERIADALNGIEDPAVRTATAMDVFGRSGRGVINMLDGYSAKVDEARAFNEKFGLSVSEIDTQSIERANDAMARIGTAIKGVGNMIASYTAPLITKMADALLDSGIDAESFAAAGQAALAIVGGSIDLVRKGIMGLQAAWNFAKGAVLQFGASALSALEPVGKAVDWILERMGQAGGRAQNLADEAAALQQQADAAFGAAGENVEALENFEKTADAIKRIRQEVLDEFAAQGPIDLMGGDRQYGDERGFNTSGGPNATGGGGGGAETPEIEALLTQLQTQREILDAWYLESQEKLLNASEAELEILGGYNEAKLRLEKEYQDRLGKIKEAGNKNQLQETLSGGAQILSALGETNEKALKISKAFAAAEAFVSVMKGAAKEMEKGIIGFGTAAAVVAKGISFVSAIRGVSASSAGGFAGGVGGFAGAAAAPAAPPPPVNEQFYNVNLTGEGPIGRDSIRGLINQLNEAIEDGAVLKGIVVTG